MGSGFGRTELGRYIDAVVGDRTEAAKALSGFEEAVDYDVAVACMG